MKEKTIMQSLKENIFNNRSNSLRNKTNDEVSHSNVAKRHLIRNAIIDSTIMGVTAAGCGLTFALGEQVLDVSDLTLSACKAVTLGLSFLSGAYTLYDLGNLHNFLKFVREIESESSKTSDQNSSKNEKAIDTDENECSVVTFERDDKISDERHSALVIQFKPNYNSENDGKDSE